MGTDIIPDVDFIAPIMPSNPEAEQALIGAAMINPAVLDETDIKPDEFYVHKNRWIWAALRSLQEKNIAPDYITLCDALTKSGKLEELGGQPYLVSLVSQIPSSMHAVGYAELVRQCYHRRQAVLIGGNLARAGYDVKANLDEEIIKAVEALAMGASSSAGAEHISLAVGEVYDEVSERAKNPVDVWGLQTGLLDVDRYIGGLENGTTFHIAGEPGIGKSILANQIGVNMATNGHGGAMYSMEMKRKLVARRALSALSKVATRTLKTGRLEDDDWTKFIGAVDKLGSLPIFLCDTPDLTIQQIRVDCARLKAQWGIEWFLVDYLLLMGGYEKLDETERSARFSKGISDIAKSLDLVGITIDSVTKDLMDGGAPNKKSVRGSGQIIHDADIVAILTEHINPGGKKNPNLATLTFTKGRELDAGLFSVDLLRTKHYPSFASVQIPGAEVREHWSDR